MAGELSSAEKAVAPSSLTPGERRDGMEGEGLAGTALEEEVILDNGTPCAYDDEVTLRTHPRQSLLAGRRCYSHQLQVVQKEWSFPTLRGR